MGYKMKGSKFYGKGSSSPAKVSDEAVVAAQKELNEVELTFRPPGWTKAARGALEGVKKIAGSMGGGPNVSG